MLHNLYIYLYLNVDNKTLPRLVVSELHCEDKLQHTQCILGMYLEA